MQQTITNKLKQKTHAQSSRQIFNSYFREPNLGQISLILIPVNLSKRVCINASICFALHYLNRLSKLYYQVSCIDVLFTKHFI